MEAPESPEARNSTRNPIPEDEPQPAPAARADLSRTIIGYRMQPMTEEKTERRLRHRSFPWRHVTTGAWIFGALVGAWLSFAPPRILLQWRGQVPADAPDRPGARADDPAAGLAGTPVPSIQEVSPPPIAGETTLPPRAPEILPGKPEPIVGATAPPEPSEPSSEEPALAGETPPADEPEARSAKREVKKRARRPARSRDDPEVVFFE
jgi:hypothetical protein